MSKKQKTLFESWNKSSASPVPGKAIKSFHLTDKNINSPLRASDYDFPRHQSTSNSFQFQESRFSKKSNELADPEFDYEAGKTWIYPTNYPIRDYQFSIAQEALYKNTLVVLPTGLGKTFIAAVVMYNIYRWYPNGKVVFMAPTKPLVAQQVNACFNITGISEEDTTQMTGTNIPELRKKMWQKKRVFFLTPQVLVNDLVSNICPASSIKCLVIDEAHKALGNHAYCQVVKELLSYTTHFRVLALTATPGSEIQAVKQVLSNLLISHVELRSEDSEDVKKYSHIRDMEKIVVPLGPRLNNLKTRFLDVINVYLRRLILRKVMPSKNPSSLSQFQMLNYRQQFSQHPPSGINSATYGLSMADFSLCISLYHAYELLLLHGTVSFYNYLTGVLNGDKSIPHARSELLKNVEFNEIMENVKESYIPDPVDQNTAANGHNNKRILPSHPKLDKLVEVVLQHFENTVKNNITDTRVMIFTQYRDSVQEIVSKLSQHQPTVKVTSFIGQSSKSSSNVGYSQKQQLEVIQKFRSGGYNVLVSTCVGEEGLDIGEVDLIVCFDCPKSPIRLVQRIGRTGRLRNGRIILLITEGKEEQMFHSCTNRKKAVYKVMSRGFSFAQFYQNNPSLIPPGVKPVCVKTHVTVKPRKLEAKGSPKSPYLTDEEMVEFNKHVRVPPIEAPILPKKEFVILKSHDREIMGREEGSSFLPNKCQLSLSDWTLWQTTPQRTDMIPHSSKSLLLVKILELIHFPELLSSQIYKDGADFAHLFEKSLNTSKAQDRCTISALKQPNILPASKVKNEEDEPEIVLSSDEDVCKVIVPELTSDSSPKSLPLIQQLFNIAVPKTFKKLDSVLKSPPSSVQIFSIEELSCASIEKFITVKNKSTSILHVLNKKMKAKLKRKSKELGRNIIFKDAKQNGLEKLHFSPKCLRTSEAEPPTPSKTFDITHKPAATQLQNSLCEKDGILFDIDFDLPDPFEKDMLIETGDVSNANVLPHSYNERGHSTLIYSEKELDSNFYLNKKSDFNAASISSDKTECTVSKYCKQLKTVKLDDVSQDNRNDFLPSLLSDKKLNDTFNITEEIISNASKAINMETPKPSKYYDSNLLDTDNIAFDSSKLSSKYIGDEVSELKRTDEYHNQGQVNKNIPCENSYSIININLNATTSNIGKYKLPLSSKFNNTASYKAIHKNSVSSEQNNLSFSKSNETTEIYPYSSVDNLTENLNECSLNFDVVFGVTNNKNESNTESNRQNISSESTKMYALQEKTNLDADLKEFDKNANSILSQLLTSQKNLSTDFNTSISSPLTIKRCISDTGKKDNFSSRKKFCKTPVTSNNLPNSSCQKPRDMFNNSESYKVSNVNDRLNHGEPNSLKTNLDKIANLKDASQCSLTQLLSLIDCTETVENKSFNKVENNLMDSFEISSISSGDEVCPTPPKAVIKSKSNFIYNKNSATKKSLHAMKSPKLQKNVSFSQESDDEAFNNQHIKETVKLTHFSPVRAEKIRSDNLKDCSLTLETEMDGNEMEFESSKIAFDISFDLPFTQENFESQAFDMNNAIIVEGSLCDSKLKPDSKNDSKFLLNETDNIHKCLDEIPSNKVNTSHINTEKDDNYLSDPSVEDSESLLTSIQTDKDVIFLSSPTNLSHKEMLPNKIGNSKPINVESFNNCQKLSEKSSNSKTDKENFGIVSTSLNENHGTETTNAPIDSSLVNCQSNDFEDTVFFKPLPNDYKLPNKHNSFSNEYENNIYKIESKAEAGKESISLRNNKNVKELKEADLNSDLICSNFKSKSRLKENGVNDNINYEKQFNDVIHASELLPEDIIVKKVSRSVVNTGNHNPVTFSEDKVCFDISFDDDDYDKTCNVLPKDQLDISENFGRMSEEQKYENYQNCLKNSLLFEEYNLPKLSSKVKDKEDLKSTDKKSIFKKNETTEHMPNNDIGKLSPSNDEMMWEFDLLDEDQNLIVEMEKDKHLSKIPIEQEKTGKNVNNNSSDEFDLPNPNPICVFKKPNQISSNPIIQKCIKSVEDISLAKETKGKEKTRSIEKDKHSSKLPIEQEQTMKNDNSSDEFDLPNPNQISVFKRPNQISSNPIVQRHIKPVENFCVTGETKGKEKTCSSSKLSSKLSKKDNKGTGMILKGNSDIDKEDEDFLFIQKIHKKIDKPSKSGHRKKKSNKHEFLLSQAEVSCSEDSDSESADESDDTLEESFIDDESSPKFNCTDQHAFYLKSIKNCVGLPQKFKLKATENETVFTNQDDEYSMYQHDSFCVDDDEVVFLSSDDNEDYKHKMQKNKGKKDKNKNSRKRLKRIITLDSSSSSEHETSPKTRKFSKENSVITSTPDNKDNYSFVAMRKKKRKLVVISDDENENMFNQPSTSKSHEVSKRYQTVNNNVTNISPHVASNSDENAKFEFCIDFEDDDFLTLNDINKIEQEISVNVVNSSTEKGISNISHVSNFSNSFPATSKASDCVSHSADNRSKVDKYKLYFGTRGSISSKDVMNFSVHPKTNSADTKVSELDKKKDNELRVMQSNSSSDLKATTKNTHCNFESPNNISTMNTLPKCNNNSLKTVKDIAGVDNDEENPNISCNIFGDEVRPVSNAVKDTSKEKIPPTTANTLKNETATTILVDSRELASGKPVISTLRNIYNVNPVVMQLQSADYILSNRLAVERVLDSEFNSTPLPPKVVEKIKEMTSIYDKSAVIIERDNRKNVLSFNKDITKYLKFVVLLNSCSSVKVLFSKSVEHSSELIAKLIQQERKKGLHINVPIELCTKRKVLYNFYSSFPKMNPICALNFLYYFPSIGMFLKSSVKDIEKNGCTSSHKAHSIFNFIHSKLTFHENM